MMSANGSLAIAARLVCDVPFPTYYLVYFALQFSVSFLVPKFSPVELF